ncbi:MAG: flagellar hook-associated protein FlgL, partial [Desulfuromonadaceae bacterium]
MKATEATTYRSLMSHINTVSERLNNLRLQSATGKKLSAPSDQPAAIRPVLLDRSQLTASDCYIEANYKALERVNTMDSHFSQMEDLMTRVKEITIAANNGSLNQADLASYAMNVAQIREELFSTANSQINGQYLFAGFSDDVTPFTANPASVSGVDYRGDSRNIKLEIGPDNRVTVNHDGNSLFLG